MNQPDELGKWDLEPVYGYRLRRVAKALSCLMEDTTGEPSWRRDFITEYPHRPHGGDEDIPQWTSFNDVETELESLKGEVAQQAQGYQQSYFLGIINALRANCSWASGQDRSYRTRASKVLQVPVGEIDEALLLEIKERIRGLLATQGYKGSFDESVACWERDLAIRPEEFIMATQELVARAKEDTSRRIVSLPDGIESEIHAVRGVFFTGFSVSLGGYRSRNSFNLDVPWPHPRWRAIVLHETFPGHQAQAVMRTLVARTGHLPLEASFGYANSPESPLREGAANLGLTFLGWQRGVDDEIQRLLAYLQSGVSLNLILRIYEEGMGEEEAVEYLRWQTGSRESWARTRFRFLQHRLWHPSFPHYWYGTCLMQNAFRIAERAGILADFYNWLYWIPNTVETLRDRIEETTGERPGFEYPET